MALPTTGTIKHSQIMAEFEKTGQFKLSADGAPLIDKSPSTIIKESDFYGASAAVEGIEQWPDGDFCSSKRPSDLNPGCSGSAGEVQGYWSSPCGLKYSVNNGEHFKSVMTYDLGFKIVGGATYEIYYELPRVKAGSWSSGNWWGYGQFGIIAGNDCRTSTLYNLKWLAKVVEQTNDNVLNFLGLGSRVGLATNVSHTLRVTAASNMDNKDAYVRFTNQNNNGFSSVFQVTVGKISCIRVG
jgi:hypothetical protein